MPKLVAVLALALMVLGAGCTGSSNERERAATCERAVELVDQMTEAESFSVPRLAELNLELSMIEAKGDVDVAIQRVNETTSQWITLLFEENQIDDSGFQIRADVIESRLALRRVCR